MFEQISKAEEMNVDLRVMKTLAGFIVEYFGYANPDPSLLAHDYAKYADLAHVLFNIVDKTAKELEKVTDKLCELSKVA